MAQSRYQYETSPRKMEPDIKRTNRRKLEVVKDVPYPLRTKEELIDTS